MKRFSIASVQPSFGDVVHEGFDAGAVGLLLGGVADALVAFGVARARRASTSRQSSDDFAEFVGEEVALFGRDLGEGGDVVGRRLPSTCRSR